MFIFMITKLISLITSLALSLRSQWLFFSRTRKNRMNKLYPFRKIYFILFPFILYFVFYFILYFIFLLLILFLLHFFFFVFYSSLYYLHIYTKLFFDMVGGMGIYFSHVACFKKQRHIWIIINDERG